METEASCTYCGLALGNSAGGSGDNRMRAPVPFVHGGFVDVRCMLERVNRPARGHVDPRSCIAGRSKWVGGSRSPHPAEVGRGLPMTESGGR